MPRLAPVHWKVFERFLLDIGCRFIREKGDHQMYFKKGINRPLVVPKYPALPIFIIRNNLRTLDISVEEYLKHL